MERTTHILFKKHRWVNDPWVLLVSSILLLPVKLLPSVLPQEIKTQRETSVLEEEQEDRGFPLQPCGRHRGWFCPRTSCHFREETPALLSLRKEGGGFCAHTTCPGIPVLGLMPPLTAQMAQGRPAHADTHLQQVHPGNTQVMRHLRSHKQSQAVAPFATGDLRCWHEAAIFLEHGPRWPYPVSLHFRVGGRHCPPRGAEARGCLPVCAEAGTQQARVTDHQKETRVGKKTPEECVS